MKIRTFRIFKNENSEFRIFVVEIRNVRIFILKNMNVQRMTKKSIALQMWATICASNADEREFPMAKKHIALVDHT